MSTFLEHINSQVVVFFSKQDCSYCDKMEVDLKCMLIPYKKVYVDDTFKHDLLDHTKVKYLPQLFIGGNYIGGYSEFATMCANGKLETLLKTYDINVEIDF